MDSVQWPTEMPDRSGRFLGYSTVPARGIVVSREDLEQWSAYDAMVRTRSRRSGEPVFIGGAPAKARWNTEFQREKRAWQVGPGPSVVGGAGFFGVDHRLSYAQVLHFPTDPAVVLRMIRAAAAPAGAAPITVVASLLSGTPLLRSARAAMIRAAEELPGIRYLGPSRDPLGRSGVAIGWIGTEPRQHSGSLAHPHQDDLQPCNRRGARRANEHAHQHAHLPTQYGHPAELAAFVSSRVVSVSSMPVPGRSH